MSCIEFAEEELEQLEKILDPFKEQRKVVKIRRGGTWYDTSVVDLNSNPKYDKTLVCVHGFGSNLLIFRFIMQSLQKYFRVIAFDLKGHGESDKSKDTYDLGMFTEQLAQIVDHYELDQFILLGQSMGTAISQNYTILNTDRVEALILSSGSADFRKPFPRFIPNIIKNIKEEFKDRLIDITFDMTVSNICDKRIVEYIKSLNKMTSYQVYRQALLHTIYIWDGTDPISTITAPTLILVGENDILTPKKEAEELSKLIPNSRLVILPDTGHSVPLERGKSVSKLVYEFIMHLIDQEKSNLNDYIDNVKKLYE